MNTESKLQRFTKHPATIEIARFAAFALATAGSKWLFGRAAAAYRERTLQSSAEQQPRRTPVQSQVQNGVGPS